MTPRKATSVAAGAMIFSVGMLLSRILGLLKESYLQQTFGNTDVTGAYKLAFMIPDLFYYLLAGGAMSAAFIPVFSSYLAKGEDHEAHQVGSTISTLLLLAMTVCVVICMVFAPNLLWLIPDSHSFTPQAFELTVTLSRILCVMLIFTAQSAHFTGILNSFRHFLAPVVVWNVYALAALFGIVVLSKMPLFYGSPTTPSIYGVAAGIVLGAFLQAAIQMPVAIAHGFKFKFMIDLAHEGVRRIFKLFVPVTISLSLSQVNILMIPMVMGAAFGLPAVNDISNANKIVMLPFGLFAAAIGNAVFPAMSQAAAVGDMTGFRSMLSRGMKIVALLSVPSVAIMIVLADPISALLYGGRKFGLDGVQATAFVLALFAFSALSLGVAQVVNRGFYSLHDTLTPTIINVFMVGGNIGFSLLLRQPNLPFQYGSVAVATTITSTIGTLVMIELLRRRLGSIDGRKLVLLLVKSLGAAVVMSAVMYVVGVWLAPHVDGQPLLPIFRWQAPHLDKTIAIEAVRHITFSRLHVAAQVGVSMLLGFAVYCGLLWVMKVEELQYLSERFLGRLRRRKADGGHQTQTAGS